MIIFNDTKQVDKRHVVEIIETANHSYAVAVNDDGTFERVMFIEDDQRTWGNEAIEDATLDELKLYRQKFNKFSDGDVVEIIKGKKMKGEIKTIKSIFTYRPKGTYSYNEIKYLGFTDGTKVQAIHCKII